LPAIPIIAGTENPGPPSLAWLTWRDCSDPAAGLIAHFGSTPARAAFSLFSLLWRAGVPGTAFFSLAFFSLSHRPRLAPCRSIDIRQILFVSGTIFVGRNSRRFFGKLPIYLLQSALANWPYSRIV
jgi:hypothetical protein